MLRKGTHRKRFDGVKTIKMKTDVILIGCSASHPRLTY